jgi:lysophospholipase L1-like esterase
MFNNPMQEMLAQMRKEKLLAYRLLNQYAKKGQIVFAGSSLAEQFPVNELLNAYDRRYIVYNRGISGDTAQGLAQSLRECVFELEPSKLFINIGSNDLNDADTASVLFEQYERILREIRENLPQISMYILSYYPINAALMKSAPDASAKFSGRTNASILDANKRLAKLAEKLHCTYIDVHKLLLDSDGNLDARYTTEGVHLLPNAYEKVLKTLIEYF